MNFNKYIRKPYEVRAIQLTRATYYEVIKILEKVSKDDCNFLSISHYDCLRKSCQITFYTLEGSDTWDMKETNWLIEDDGYYTVISNDEFEKGYTCRI